MEGNREQVVILMSGGIDSAACVAFYHRLGCDIEGLFIDYGQGAHIEEENAAVSIAKHYGIALRVIRHSGGSAFSSGLIVGRNLFLAGAALMHLGKQDGVIVIGIHAGTKYQDCSPEFATRMQRLFDLYSDGGVVFRAPFVIWRKDDIWDFCITAEVPIELTYSCERGGSPPCGKCMSCKEREALRARKADYTSAS